MVVLLLSPSQDSRPECRGPVVLNQCSPAKLPENRAWLLGIADLMSMNVAGDFSRLRGSLLYTPQTVDHSVFEVFLYTLVFQS